MPAAESANNSPLRRRRRQLDVGVEERILLTSRDEETCLIVSYKELKKCIEQSFRELL